MLSSRVRVGSIEWSAREVFVHERSARSSFGPQDCLHSLGPWPAFSGRHTVDTYMVYRAACTGTCSSYFNVLH